MKEDQENKLFGSLSLFLVILVFFVGIVTLIVRQVMPRQANYSAIPNLLSEDGLTETEQLAYIIAAECMQCDSVEKSMVGSVVLNRIEVDGFPETIEGVITDENAFHGYCSAQYVYEPESYIIAQSLINGVERDTAILYFYKKELNKPKWVNKVIYKMKYHNFGK